MAHAFTFRAFSARLLMEPMNKAVKIRSLSAPGDDLSAFDPGHYLANLEFYETDDAITDAERDGLAQFAHYLAFLALRAQSSKWSGSTVPYGSSAYQALTTHFGQLPGWDDIAPPTEDLKYGELVRFLMQFFPPHPRNDS